MDVTLNRLIARKPLWGAEKVTPQAVSKFTKILREQPFSGDVEDRKFGFAQCGNTDEVIYGLFVQKFPKVIIDYKGEEKQEERQKIRDTGEYLFIFYPKRFELYLQARRSRDLPGTTEIIQKFVSLWRFAASDGGMFLVDTFDYTRDIVDRDRIVKIFYEEADAITELELEGFDRSLIDEQKRLRGGGYQTYFNPIDEYQPAMDEAAYRFGKNADKVTVKAKAGER